MLETTGYLRPGAYIGQLIRPANAAVTGFPRLPCFVAKGSRLARARNSEIIRAKVYDESLSFTGVGPYSAILAFQADGNKLNTELLVNGVKVPENQYLFATTTVTNDTIRIPSQYFQPSGTYVVTYQSIDRTVLDPVPFENLRAVERVGRSIDSSNYDEFTDFVLPVTVSTVTADAGNNAGTADNTEYGTTNGALAKVTIAGPSGENIVLTGESRFTFTVDVVSGGSESIVENTGTRVVTLTFVDTTSTQTSLTSTITAALTGLTLVGAVTGGSGTTAWADPAQVQLKLATALDVGGSNTGDGSVSFATTSDYTHAYTRDYTVECVTGGDSATAAFAWYSSPNSLGNSVAVHNPHPDLVTVAAHRNSIAAPGDLVAVALEYGLQVVFHDQGGTFDVGDKWTFRAFAPSKIEIDTRHSATNQFTTIGSVTNDGTPSGSGVLSVYSSASDFTGTYKRVYHLEVSAIAGTPTATFKWQAVGDDGVATGTTAALASGGTALLDNGVTITVNMTSGNFAIGDAYTFTVTPANVVPSIKDDRTYTIEVDTPLTGNVSFLYFTDTPEGSIGSFTATTADSHIEMQGNLTIHVRNLVGPRYTASDEFTFSVVLDDVIDWSLQTEITESVAEASIIHDILGRITGTPDTYYVVLTNAPDTVVSVKNSVPAAVSYSIVTSGGVNTRYINFGATSPADDLTIVYRFKGKEPAPGEAYRFSGLYLREDSLYNTPNLVTSESQGVALVEPIGTDNHLAIVNAIAWKYAPLGIYLSQVKDADDDGIFQDSDYETAITATEGIGDITDLVVLDSWTTLAQQIAHIDNMADPLLNKQRLLWLGAPIGTPIGDVNTSGSLVYTAKNTLAVYGDSQSHGTRILVAPTECEFTLLIDRVPHDITLDGSFVAAALCLQYASFRNPSKTALRLPLTAFKTVQEYEVQEDNILGAAQIVYIKKIGDSIYRWEEDVTTDPIGTEAAPDEFRIISAMTQKRYMNRRIQSAVDNVAIGLTPDAPDAGISVIRNAISSTVSKDVTDGNIGQYLNSNGAERKINPGTDIVVFRGTDQKTVYRFYVGYFLKYPIKHVFGLAATDTNNFGIQPGNL